MNDNEKALDYVLGDTLPQPGRAVTVAPGIKWLRMALPFALDHVNIWLLRDETVDSQGQRVQGLSLIHI